MARVAHALPWLAMSPRPPFLNRPGGALPEPVCGILLAAGVGRRWQASGPGDDKLMHPLSDGTPVVVAAARALHQAVPRAVAVVRSDLDAAAAALEACGLQVIRLPSGDLGMGHSLAAAVRATPWAHGWVVTLGDMPWVKAHTVWQVADAVSHGQDLVAPYYCGTRGHVLGFGANQRTELAQLSADGDVRELLARHADQLQRVTVDDPGVLLDVDLPDSLVRGLVDGEA